MGYRYTRNKIIVDRNREIVGECQKCGYNKYWQILEYHHRNQGEKTIILSGRALNRSSEYIIEKEMEKCTLLCPNCHAELHHEIREKEKKEWKW